MSVTVQSKSAAPAKVAPASRKNHLYCEGPACSYAWAQDSIENVETMRYLFVRIEGVPHVSYFCASCHASLTDDEKRNVPIINDNLVNTTSLSRLDRLDSYHVLLANVKAYILPLACIVLFLPILGPLLALGGGRRLPARLLELWPRLPKGQVCLTFVLLAATYVGIALSFPFTSQCVFWGLLEVYSVLYSLVNILAHTNINGYINPSDSLHRNRNPFIQLQYAMFRVLCSGGVPVLGLLELLILISTPPLAPIVYSSSKRLSDPTDLKALSLLDSTTQEPIDPSFLPGVFVSRPIQRRIVGIMGWRRFTLIVGLLTSVAINGLLTASWVGGVFPSFDFVVPGAYALVSSPANAAYGMFGELAARSCASTTNGLSTTSSVVWNLGFEPAPTVDVGLPLVTLSFHNARQQPVPFTIETAWNIQLVNQSGSDAAFYPLPKEAYFSLRANFDGNCTAMRALRPVATVYYATSSLQMYVAAQTLDFWMVLFPLFLLLKQIAQCGVFSICIGGLSGRIWALWIKFDSISSVGLYPHFGNTPIQVDLSCRTNLIAWMAVRRSVIGATHLFTSFVKPLLSLALVQLAIAFGGLLVYALTGTGPMPTYFLLVLALVSSISTLVFLYPLSEAMEIQANHGDMLRDVQLQHLLKKGVNDTDDGVGNLLSVYVDVIDNHDDRITFWGTETSKEKLQGLVVTLASGLSFIGSKTVQYEWSTLNPHYIGNNIPQL